MHIRVHICAIVLLGSGRRNVEVGIRAKATPKAWVTTVRRHVKSHRGKRGIATVWGGENIVKEGQHRNNINQNWEMDHLSRGRVIYLQAIIAHECQGQGSNNTKIVIVPNFMRARLSRWVQSKQHCNICEWVIHRGHVPIWSITIIRAMISNL